MDTIADFLTRIRNALMVKKREVTAPYSKMKAEIARILMEEGFISNFQISDDQRTIIVYLKYGPRGESVIRDLRRVSKPSRRVYVGWREIPKVKNGLGIAILSTSKGILSDREARRQRVGGELLCEVW